jgi:hypothetical protein
MPPHQTEICRILSLLQKRKSSDHGCVPILPATTPSLLSSFHSSLSAAILEVQFPWERIVNDGSVAGCFKVIVQPTSPNVEWLRESIFVVWQVLLDLLVFLRLFFAAEMEMLQVLGTPKSFSVYSLLICSALNYYVHLSLFAIRLSSTCKLQK